MLCVIKRIPYTPLVTLICSLFSIQACIKRSFDLGFLALNFLFFHSFSSFCVFAGCTCLQRSRRLIQDQSLRWSGVDRLWTTGAQRRKWPAAPWSAAWTRVRLQWTVGWKKGGKKTPLHTEGFGPKSSSRLSWGPEACRLCTCPVFIYCSR